jgi:hypothetical protein
MRVLDAHPRIVHFYGCARCQCNHYEMGGPLNVLVSGEPHIIEDAEFDGLYEAHLFHQSKHGIHAATSRLAFDA